MFNTTGVDLKDYWAEQKLVEVRKLGSTLTKAASDMTAMAATLTETLESVQIEGGTSDCNVSALVNNANNVVREISLMLNTLDFMKKEKEMENKKK